MTNKKYILYIFIAACLLIAAFFVGRNSLKDDLMYSNQNLIAATDSIHKLNDLNAYEKSVYYLKEKELNDMLGISNSEISKLKKELNDKIAYISKIESNIEIDTIFIDSTSVRVDSASIDISFKYNERWLEFNGDLTICKPEYDISKFNINYLNIPAPLTIGLTSGNKLFIESENPYINVSRMDGAYVIENMISKNALKPKWSHGISIGIGFQYGLVNKNLDFGPQVGYSVTYNF